MGDGVFAVAAGVPQVVTVMELGAVSLGHT
jgi:hypothetical protein